MPFPVPEQPPRPSQQPPVPPQPGRASAPAPPPVAPPRVAPPPVAATPVGQAPPGPPVAARPAPPTGSTYQSTPDVPKKSGEPQASGKRRVALLLVVVLFLVALVGAGAAVQLTRDLPTATLTTEIASTIKIPGSAPKIPWPGTGSAELMIEGMGRIGGSGGKGAEPIGSVAKVMTAYVILKNHPLEGDAEGPSMTVDAADVADYNQRTLTGQSQVRIEVGEKLTERDALEALMLPSANNVAHMLAEWDADTVDGFLEKMNDAADELGMTETEYTDPSGFLPTTISTAADQVKLARAALKIEAFAEIVELPSAEIPVEGTVKNYNDLLGENGVFGIKTGSTDQAGGNLLFAARLKVGSRDLVIVGAVFNQPGANTPEQLAAVNKVVRKLLTAVGRTVKEYPLVAAKPVGSVRTAWGSSVTVTPASPLKVVGWPGLAVPVKTTTATPGSLVTAGQQVGEVQAAGVRVPLRADAATSEPSLWWKLTRRS
uniref:D-alanyl-D-alanine carboxypeptidase family protein n=1 Tax=Actinoplanes octamycinicus TaxID=135948 RepID=UPI00367100ED